MQRELKGGIIAIVAIVLIAIILLHPQFPIENQNPDKNPKNTTKIIISLYFGEKIVEERDVEPGNSVIDTLEQIANVSTAYNGKFVTGINGINQNGTFFWFYYVNGILANVGASLYKIHPGDIIRWDFHRWNSKSIQYAELADFPEPFWHGYDGRVYNTTIVYQKEYLKYAKDLNAYFKRYGINATLTENITNEELQRNNVIIIGYNTQICTYLNNIHTKLGWDYSVKNGYIEDSRGYTYYGSFIQVSQSPYNPRGLNSCENVIIWIYGTNENYLKESIENLMSGSISSFWYFHGEKI